MTGNYKRQDKKADEEMLMMRALRDMNLSKLVADDIPIFNGLLSDIFPKQVIVPKKVYPEIESKFPEVIKDSANLVLNTSFSFKIIQLYETSIVRHGYIMIGSTGSGKTTILKTLTEALTKNGKTTRIVTMNPKAIRADEFYGVKNDISDYWTPGVFSELWARYN